MKNKKNKFERISLSKNSKKKVLTERKEKKFWRTDSGDENVLCCLPKINKKLANIALSKPTSLLTLYLNKYTQSVIQKTEEDLKRPIKIIPKLNIKDIKNKTQNFGFIYKEKGKSPYSMSERNRKKIDLNKEKEIKKVLNKHFGSTTYLTDTKNEKKEESKSEENVSNQEEKNEEKKDSLTNTNININNSKNENTTTDNKIIDIQSLLNDPKKRCPNPINTNQMMPLEKCKRIDKYFRRIRTYQPKIFDNWKEKAGMSVTVGGNNSGRVGFSLQKDIHYQSNMFQDEAKLIEDDILYYKMQIVSLDIYIDSFKILPLQSKINYNKTLEETIGILILLPQLILNDFYKFVEKFDNINIPDKSKFVEKFVFDEVQNLYYNNNLLSEALEFFQNCFEVYLILIKEVDDMSLKPRNYNKVMSSFEKARYNIYYVINSSKNAIENYKSDLKMLDKFNKNMGINEKCLSHETGKKNRFVFNKNEERQRKLRIDACLSYRKSDDVEDEGKLRKHNFYKNKFHSIIDSKLITKLLKHCKKEQRQQITTQRINKEIDGDIGDEGEEIVKKHKVIKLNY